MIVKIPHFPVYCHPDDVHSFFVDGPLGKGECKKQRRSLIYTGKFAIQLILDNGDVYDMERDELFDTIQEAYRACEEVKNLVNAELRKMQDEQSILPGDEWKLNREEDDDDDSTKEI